jgi:SAM-dependent methyltransferase
MPASREFMPGGRWRSVAYRALWRAAGCFQKAANGCLYLSAGLLRPDDLRAAGAAQWNAFSQATDDVDAGLMHWEHRIYNDVLGGRERVLLVGCGAGRDLVALKRMGHDVTGIDVSSEITELARAHLARHQITANVLTGFIEETDPGGPYDAIIFSGRSYGCIRGTLTRIGTLSRLRKSLTDEGRTVISYNTTGAERRVARWMTAMTARLAGSGWHPERGDRFTGEHLAPGVLRYEHMFQPHDIAAECGTAGFGIERDEITDGAVRVLVARPVGSGTGSRQRPAPHRPPAAIATSVGS